MTILQTRRAWLFVAFCFLHLLCLSPFGWTSDDSSIREFRGRTMGTTYMVKVAGADELPDDELRIKIDSELRRVNDQMSTYLATSEITSFNESTSTDWYAVSPEFARVVDFAQQVAAKTQGAFDVTVAPLVNAWSFGTTDRTYTVPDETEIKGILETVGYEKLSVRLDPPALRKAIPGLNLDLSSIAKGHGVDRIVQLLADLGAKNVFVEIGGEIRTAGAKPDGAWRVGIQRPDARADVIMIAHPMEPDDPAGTAMATSGDYRNAFEVDGKTYSHTIDPRTGAPISHHLASVTVIAPTSMGADAWATALNVLGPQQGKRIADQQQLHCLLVSRTPDDAGQGAFEMSGTGILQQYVPEPIAEEDAAEQSNWLESLLPVAILSFGAFVILLFAMGLGVMLKGKPISGSCGGIASQTNPDGSASCALCSNPSDACQELREKMAKGSS